MNTPGKYRRVPLLTIGVFFWGLALGLTPALRAGSGKVVDVQTLLSNGDPSTRIDLVFLGDGFTEAEQTKFNNAVDQAMNGLFAIHPFGALKTAFNVHRVNVVSNESGIDIPLPKSCKDTDGSAPDDLPPDLPHVRDTAMDSQFCWGGEYFRMVGAPTDRIMKYSAAAPDDDFICVLVNEEYYGGSESRGTVTFSTLHGWKHAVLAHELGHAIGLLADEYNTGEAPKYAPPPGGVDPRPNVDVLGGPLKWIDLVSAMVPTQVHPNCENARLPCPPEGQALDQVGAYEGASHFRCGIFRPQYACAMRSVELPFCTVCRRELIRNISRSSFEFEVLIEDLDLRLSQDLLRGATPIYLAASLGGGSAPQQLARWPAGTPVSPGAEQELAGRYVLTSLPRLEPRSLELILRSAAPGVDPALTEPIQLELTPKLQRTHTEDLLQLKVKLQRKPLLILLDTLFLKDGTDAFGGNVVVDYEIRNGVDVITGRWPQNGPVHVRNLTVRSMGVLGGRIPVPESSQDLTLEFHVKDQDGGTWQTIGHDTVIHPGPDFGQDQVVHWVDSPGYRLTYSITRER